MKSLIICFMAILAFSSNAMAWSLSFKCKNFGNHDSAIAVFSDKSDKNISTKTVLPRVASAHCPMVSASMGMHILKSNEAAYIYYCQRSGKSYDLIRSAFKSDGQMHGDENLIGSTDEKRCFEAAKTANLRGDKKQIGQDEVDKLNTELLSCKATLSGLQQDLISIATNSSERNRLIDLSKQTAREVSSNKKDSKPKSKTGEVISK